MLVKCRSPKEVCGPKPETYAAWNGNSGVGPWPSSSGSSWRVMSIRLALSQPPMDIPTTSRRFCTKPSQIAPSQVDDCIKVFVPSGLKIKLLVDLWASVGGSRCSGRRDSCPGRREAARSHILRSTCPRRDEPSGAVPAAKPRDVRCLGRFTRSAHATLRRGLLSSEKTPPSLSRLFPPRGDTRPLHRLARTRGRGKSKLSEGKSITPNRRNITGSHPVFRTSQFSILDGRRLIHIEKCGAG